MGVERRAPIQHWSLSKNISVGVIVALMFNVFGGIWFAASAFQRLSYLEEWVKQNQTVDRRLAVIEERQNDFTVTMREVKDLLNRMVSAQR